MRGGSVLGLVLTLFGTVSACADPPRGASLSGGESREAPTTTTSATTPTESAASPASTTTSAPTAPIEEPVEEGPFLTTDDAPVAPSREAPLPGDRSVIVPLGLGLPSRTGTHELVALTGERFVYLDAHRLAVIDGEAGRVLGTRVLDEEVEHVAWETSSDRGGRYVAFERSDAHVCVWDLDLDRVDCTPGYDAMLSPGGRSLFLSTETEPVVRLDLANARRHTLDQAPRLPSGQVHAVSPSERRVLVATSERSLPRGQLGEAWLLDATNGALVRHVEHVVVPRDPFRPAGGTWVTWSSGMLSFRDTLTGALRRREPLELAPQRMYWSADGTTAIAYRYESGRAHAFRFEATTGAPLGDVTMSSIPHGFFAPGFRPDGSFDFFGAHEVPSATGRTAARVDDVGLHTRRTDGSVEHHHDDTWEEDVVLDAISTPEALVLVTPFAEVILRHTGLTSRSLFLHDFVEESEDDPPNSDGTDWTNYGFDEAGLLSVGGGVFVERYGGIPRTLRGGTVAMWPDPAIPCEPVEGRACCLASGSVDERSGRRVVRMLDRLAVFERDGIGPPRVMISSSCEEACGDGEQCDGQECTRDTTDSLGLCMLRPDEQPRFDTDGARVVTTTHDGAVETFEVASGRRLGRIARARGEELPAQAFDIAPDGSVVAFARGRNLHLHEVTGARRGTVEARFARPVRFVRYLEGGAILAGLADDSLHFVDAATLAETSTIARPGFRADAPSRMASVLCREGSLRWLEHRPGASADAAREIGRCDRDARMIVTDDLAFVVEVQGARTRIHRVDDGRVVTLSVGHHTTFVELDEDELNDETPSTPWALVANDAGAIEVVDGTPVGAFSRRTGGVRRGSLTASFTTASLSPITAAFMAPTTAAASPTPTPTTTATPTTTPTTTPAP